MEASINVSASQRNWGMIARVGVIAALVLGLVGYAAKVTYVMLVKGGVEKRGDYYEVDLRSMSNFDMDQKLGTVADVPERFRNLDGKKVLLEGEVAPASTYAGSTTDELLICYSVARCCVGMLPKVQHFVVCRPAPGKTVTNYQSSTQVKVYGTLHVKMIKDGGVISSIFQLDMDRIDPIS